MTRAEEEGKWGKKGGGRDESAGVGVEASGVVRGVK